MIPNIPHHNPLLHSFSVIFCVKMSKSYHSFITEKNISGTHEKHKSPRLPYVSLVFCFAHCLSLEGMTQDTFVGSRIVYILLPSCSLFSTSTVFFWDCQPQDRLFHLCQIQILCKRARTRLLSSDKEKKSKKKKKS